MLGYEGLVTVDDFEILKKYPVDVKPSTDIPCDHSNMPSRPVYLYWGHCDFLLPPPDFEQLSDPFKAVVSSVIFYFCSVSERGLLEFINHFPNLKHLRLILIDHAVDPEQPSSSPKRLKKLSIILGPNKSPDLLEKLSELGLSFDKVCIEVCSVFYPWTKSANKIISTFGASVQYLTIPNIPENPERLTLSECHELRELEFDLGLDSLDNEEIECISSTTPTAIEKIIIRRHPFEGVFPAPKWTRLDDVLLVERPRLKKGLEVEFRGRWNPEGFPDVRIDTYLPKFVAKKGRVIVRDQYDELVHRSDDFGEGGDSSS